MRAPVRITLVVALSLGALLAAVMIAGSRISRTHIATSEITLKQPIDSVYAVVRDLGAFPTWWNGATSSVRVATAPGERWRVKMAGADIAMDVVDDAPPLRFTTRIVEEPGAPFGGTWTYVLTPVATGTTISVTENGWIGPPMFRVVSRISGYHATIDAMLGALGGRFGEQVVPVHK